MAIATFAAGCFWGVEDAFRQVPGVIAVEVGYTGGHTIDPSYEQVCGHDTGHAEAVRIEYDPEQINYQELLSVFWQIHDPTQKNRQGLDVGDQYRSAIFYHDETQRQIAEQAIIELNQSKRFNAPIATEITKARDFYRAEEYHQQYFKKHNMRHCSISIIKNKDANDND